VVDAFDFDAPVINRNTLEHHCFGCGTLNEFGLQLAFRRARGGVWAELRPDRRYEGYVGIVHGGVLTAMLDEAMSWAITAEGQFAMTARLNTTFRRPARVGSVLRVEGQVVEQRRRLIDATATITDVDSGAVVAVADGRFMRVSAAQEESWRDSYAEREAS
jgi:uncharacterized protein (TIGR00369 family)